MLEIEDLTVSRVRASGPALAVDGHGRILLCTRAGDGLASSPLAPDALEALALRLLAVAASKAEAADHAAEVAAAQLAELVAGSRP
ncbi:MAG: hypothetical protein U1E45_05685 [Geminicoccaceae bacterium]